METLIGIICFIWILSLVVFAICMVKAPIGFEDETGFHYGDDQVSRVNFKDPEDGKHLHESHLNYSRGK